MTNYTPLYSNEAYLGELGRRIEQLRIRRDITQAHLAKEAGIGKRTLERMESGKAVQLLSFIAVLRVLDCLEGFLDLIPDQSESPVAKLALAEKERRYRASGKRSTKKSTSPSENPGSWRWGDSHAESPAK